MPASTRRAHQHHPLHFDPRWLRAEFAGRLRARPAGLVYAVLRFQERRWRERYHAALREIEEREESRKPSSGRFLMTPAQHREQAALIRQANGPEELARQHDMLAQMIERGAPG